MHPYVLPGGRKVATRDSTMDTACCVSRDLIHQQFPAKYLSLAALAAKLEHISMPQHTIMLSDTSSSCSQATEFEHIFGLLHTIVLLVTPRNTLRQRQRSLCSPRLLQLALPPKYHLCTQAHYLHLAWLSRRTHRSPLSETKQKKRNYSQ